MMQKQNAKIMIRHSNISVEWYESLVKNCHVGSMKGTQILIDDTRARGYKYIPVCDHIDEDGSCVGHEKENDAA